MPVYTIAADGDAVEQRCHPLFLQTEFPSYERFWQERVVPLTNRPDDIHFKTDAQLAAAGYSARDICIAQLHYSVLRHLAVVHDLKASPATVTYDALTEGFVHLCGALDLAFELLERNARPQLYDPWTEESGRLAKRAWQKANGFPLQGLRNYRNHLVHGRMLPGVVGGAYWLPRIGREATYYDWRLITDPARNPGLNPTDLQDAGGILVDAWTQTLDYLEQSWRAHLITPAALPTPPPPLGNPG